MHVPLRSTFCLSAGSLLCVAFMSGCGPGYSESESIASEDVSFSVCAKREADGWVRVATGSTLALDGCRERAYDYVAPGVWLSGGDRLVASTGEQRAELFRTRAPLIYEGELASLDPTRPMSLDVVMSRGDGTTSATIVQGLPVPAVPTLALSDDTVVAATAESVEAVWTPPTIDAPVAGTIDARPLRCVDAAGEALAAATLPTLQLPIDASAGRGTFALTDELRRLPSDAHDCRYEVVLTFVSGAIDEEPNGISDGYSFEPTSEVRASSPPLTVRLIGPFPEASS